MKKVTLIIATISLMTFASCKDKEEVTKETVIVEKEAATPTEEESDGTSISISKDGVDFSTNDGDNKVEVEIDADKK